MVSVGTVRIFCVPNYYLQLLTPSSPQKKSLSRLLYNETLSKLSLLVISQQIIPYDKTDSNIPLYNARRASGVPSKLNKYLLNKTYLTMFLSLVGI